MCGIFGVVAVEPLQDMRMLMCQRDALLHRGPDGEGFWRSDDGRVVLTHRRLAILDLSDLARQPMFSADWRYSVVFNGEIYNFSELRRELCAFGWQFQSQSDTEVVLNGFQQWGVDCLNHFVGMFAFAIYDKREHSLFLARDRAGEKPLYYSHGPDGFYFASELKALLENPSFDRSLSEEALDCFLAFGYVPGEMCILKNARKLPPAHAMLLAGDQLKIWRYWSLPATNADICADVEALSEEFTALLENSVKQQMVADVPVGILLSGGLDSSLVTALAVRNHSQVKTFTVRFPGYGKLDETEHARLIARHFATEHVELDAGDTVPELLSKLAVQFDEPMVDSSMIPTFLVSQLVRQHCTVALGGDGGDELFGGYAQYCHFSRMAELIGWLPASIRHPFGRVTESILPLGFKGRNWFRMAGVDFASEVPVVGSLFEPVWRSRLLHRPVKVFAEGVWSSRTPAVSNLLERYTRMDFANYLPEDILVKVDRAAMLNSLEMRAPFLDHRLIDFAFSKIPPQLKATARAKKIFLKMAASKILPAEFDFKRKQGFSIPLQQWLQKPQWQALVNDTLLASDCSFDRSVCLSLLQGNLPAVSNSERVFALTLFEIWRKHYRISLPSSKKPL